MRERDKKGKREKESEKERKLFCSRLCPHVQVAYTLFVFLSQKLVQFEIHHPDLHVYVHTSRNVHTHVHLHMYRHVKMRNTQLYNCKLKHIILTCVYVYIHVECVHTCTPTHISTCKYENHSLTYVDNIPTCICTYMSNVHTHVHLHMYRHVNVRNTHLHITTIYLHIYVHTCRTCTHMYTYIYIDT